MADMIPSTGEERELKIPGPQSPIPSAPPHPLDSQWHLHVDGQTYGPYSGHQMGEFAKEGRINGATQVLLVGSEKWLHAAEEPRLAPIFKATHATPAAPPISAAPGATVVQVTNTISPTPAYALIDGEMPDGPKSPGIALLLSLLFCGAGQMYCGRVGRGFAFLIGCIVLWFVLLGWIINIWSIIDAYSLAKTMNMRWMQRMQAIQAR